MSHFYTCLASQSCNRISLVCFLHSDYIAPLLDHSVPGRLRELLRISRTRKWQLWRTGDQQCMERYTQIPAGVWKRKPMVPESHKNGNRWSSEIWGWGSTQSPCYTHAAMHSVLNNQTHTKAGPPVRTDWEEEGWWVSKVFASGIHLLTVEKSTEHTAGWVWVSETMVAITVSPGNDCFKKSKARLTLTSPFSVR